MTGSAHGIQPVDELDGVGADGQRWRLTKKDAAVARDRGSDKHQKNYQGALARSGRRAQGRLTTRSRARAN